MRRSTWISKTMERSTWIPKTMGRLIWKSKTMVKSTCTSKTMEWSTWTSKTVGRSDWPAELWRSRPGHRKESRKNGPREKLVSGKMVRKTQKQKIVGWASSIVVCVCVCVCGMLGCDESTKTQNSTTNPTLGNEPKTQKQKIVRWASSFVVCVWNVRMWSIYENPKLSCGKEFLLTENNFWRTFFRGPTFQGPFLRGPIFPGIIFPGIFFLGTIFPGTIFRCIHRKLWRDRPGHRKLWNYDPRNLNPGDCSVGAL